MVQVQLEYLKKQIKDSEKLKTNLKMVQLNVFTTGEADYSSREFKCK